MYCKFEMEVNPASKVFRRFYVRFDELKRNILRGCKHVMGFDGCFHKTKLKGLLFLTCWKRWKQSNVHNCLGSHGR